MFFFRYFTGNTKGSDGKVQFVAGKTSLSNAMDAVIKIFTIAVSVFMTWNMFLLCAFGPPISKYRVIQVTIVVVAVPEGLPLAVTLT